MKNYLYTLLIILTFSCKTPYEPALSDPPMSYLVVEGIINSSNADSTLIKLSRTVPVATKLNDILLPSANRNPELNARVFVEDGQGFSIKLKDLGHGNYSAAPLGLNDTKKYRLRIETAGNRTYISDLESVVPTPPIDSIGFRVKNNNVQVYLNTHDPKNNTRYYRWDFSEAWKFHAAYESDYIVEGSKIVERTPELRFPEYCWGSSVSYDINVSSSIKLSQDVIYQVPITLVEGSSDKIMDRYSIEVKQYALTKEAYLFWAELKRNTESLGTIFDAQPSASRSNIHCIQDANEPVMGYISVTAAQHKRVYVNKSELHLPVLAASFSYCKLDSQYFCHPTPICSTSCPIPPSYTLQPPCGVNDIALYLMTFIQIPTAKFWGAGPYDPAVTPPAGYLSSTHSCLDCSTRGASKPPPFWIDD